MSSRPLLSVIVCAHQPAPDRLAATLDALQHQTLPLDHWELLVVDNASIPPLTASLDLSWHPHGRLIEENTLGLTPARLAGFAAAGGRLLVLVDDDNVLANDYLAQVVALADAYPQIGAFGGDIQARFEAAPTPEVRPYLGVLALRDVTRPLWACYPETNPSVPCGAGLVVRAEVSAHYRDLVREDPLRAALDRRGENLSSCGDTDLALTAVDLGLGTAVFPSLKLTHLIPRRRVDPAYLLQLIENLERSRWLLAHVRRQLVPPPASPLVRAWAFLNRWRHRSFAHQVLAAARRGHRRACVEIHSLAARS